jgi:hypothetical protein
VGLVEWLGRNEVTTPEEGGRRRSLWRYVSEVERVRDDAVKAMTKLQLLDSQLSLAAPIDY